MCFQLYAATIEPLPVRQWKQNSSVLPIQPLSERETPIRAHFSSPSVQHIGSTSGCSCDIPAIMFQNGDWPSWEESEMDAEDAASDRINREGLVDILRKSFERSIELYGVWDGDFDKNPECFENLQIETILDPKFKFKERGFYRINLGSQNQS